MDAKDKKSRLCFVIMPFGSFFDSYYRELYQPSVRDAGLEPMRADSLFAPSEIIQDIWSLTQRAELLLADLTGRNPNVFYELGLAHAIGKPVVLVTNSIEDVPFDLRGLRVITYNKDEPNWGSQLRVAITASIKEVLESPREAILPTFLRSRGSIPEAPTVTEEGRLYLELRQEITALRQEFRAFTTAGLRKPHAWMNAEDVANVIRLGLSEGLTDDQINMVLVNKGIEQEDINVAFRSARTEDCQIRRGPFGGEND